MNGDQTVNLDDAKMILKYLAGKLELSTDQLAAADFNQDGQVDKSDATLIIKQVSGGHGKKPD